MGTKISRLTVAFTVGLLLSGWLGLAGAQEPFYKGKTMRIIVGGSAGGGELERIVAGTFKLAPELVEKLKEILK
ncbi:MAG: hypothetical protein HYT78_13345 [Deltaproteobacteria bacterium]|nr:hypothetical protein [Deltaproteobacteria bacterium]